MCYSTTTYDHYIFGHFVYKGKLEPSCCKYESRQIYSRSIRFETDNSQTVLQKNNWQDISENQLK